MKTQTQRGWGLGWVLVVSGLAAGAGFRHLEAAGFAVEVMHYEPGIGYATDWATGEGYTDPSVALGSPSRVTVDPDPVWGGTFAVDPFSPPYRRDQLVSIGAGGSLTVRLEVPAINDPRHSYGMDFIIYGSAGFIITNGDFTGGGITDGSLFGATTGETRVEVSADGQVFYPLDASLAPVVDALYPTDGSGTFGWPVNPALRAEDFDGLGLGGIRALYGGSAGGTGYDLAWARDAAGNPVTLDAAQYLRVSVLSGHAEIDGFAVVLIPEPGPLGLFGLGLGWLMLQARRRIS